MQEVSGSIPLGSTTFFSRRQLAASGMGTRPVERSPSANMARTQAADYDQRREEIVEHAARLYAKRGFLGASMSDLAQICSLSKSAIYHYYTAKEDILFDVMHAHVRALDLAARAAIACSDDPKQQLRALARSFMRLYVGAAARHKVLLNDLQHLPALRRAEA